MTRALILNAVSTPEQARKFSLKYQDEISRTYCTAQGWEVVESLFSDTSRFEYDNIDDIARVNKAFAMLRQHIEAKDFDVLIIHSFDRLARDPALIVQLIQRVVRTGATIWAHQGGEVNATNYLILCGAITFMIAAPIRTFVEKSQATKEKQAQAGLHAEGKPSMIHRVVRNEQGRRIGMEVNEVARPLFMRLAELLADPLKKITWDAATAILLKEGFTTPSGAVLRKQTLYRTVVHPEFWGNMARNFWRTTRAGKNIRYNYEWIFDADYPPPPDVRIYYNTHPPFLSGDLAERLKARLRQDFAAKGRARHAGMPSAFRGLVVCVHCGLALTWHRRGKYVYGSCSGRWYKPPTCDQRNITTEVAVREALDARLREITVTGDLQPISTAEAAAEREHVHALQAALVDVEKELAGLLRDKALTEDHDLLTTYSDLISSASARLKAVRSQLQRAQTQMISEDADYARHRAAQELIALTVDGFWKLPQEQQNRLLHQLFGHYRLVANGRKIVGIMRTNRQKRFP